MSEKVANPDSCPNCGASLKEIEKGARFSCTECYTALGNRLFELFAQMHAATDHKGKSPKAHGANCFAAIDMQKKLRDFEEVAGGELFDENLENVLDDFLKPNPEPVKLSAEVVETPAPAAEPQPEPETPQSLQKQLDKAIADERYEDAAKIRDRLKNLSDQ